MPKRDSTGARAGGGGFGEPMDWLLLEDTPLTAVATRGHRAAALRRRGGHRVNRRVRRRKGRQALSLQDVWLSSVACS